MIYYISLVNPHTVSLLFSLRTQIKGHCFPFYSFSFLLWGFRILTWSLVSAILGNNIYHSTHWGPFLSFFHQPNSEVEFIFESVEFEETEVVVPTWRSWISPQNRADPSLGSQILREGIPYDLYGEKIDIRFFPPTFITCTLNLEMLSVEKIVQERFPFFMVYFALPTPFFLLHHGTVHGYFSLIFFTIIHP